MQTNIANKALMSSGVQANKPYHGAARRQLTVRAVAAPPKLNTKRSEEVSRKVKRISLMQEFTYMLPHLSLCVFFSSYLPHSNPSKPIYLPKPTTFL